jgi:magnesium transporter
MRSRRKRRIGRQRRKLAQPPGTLIYVGDAGEAPAQLTLTAAGSGKSVANPDDAALAAIIGQQTVYWLQVQGLHDIAAIARLGRLFSLHPLVQEDILDTTHRPKAEDYGAYLFITLKIPVLDRENDERWLNQVSLVLGANYVISFIENPSSSLAGLEKWMAGEKWRRSNYNAGYLLYSILDAIIDGYYVYLDAWQDDYEALEKDILHDPATGLLPRIMDMKHEAINIRKTLWPLREIVTQLNRQGLMPEGGGLYLRDIGDHVIQLIDSADGFRDLMNAALDIYLSSINNRTNDVMKVLTIFASLFMPLTFMTSLYGMNFQYMPELSFPWAYPALLGLLAALVVIMLMFFRRRRWPWCYTI